MRVGIPTEIKVQEFRVGITPAGVHALKEAGHTVLVQKGAGLGSMITDEEYVAAGAQMVATAKECWDCDMVVKVKEPLAPEYDLFHEGLILYTYLHLAPEPALTKALLEKKVIGIAYETVQFDNGFLPLLAPMSEVAGRMATQVGAQMLTKIEGGMGLLMGGTAGVQAAHVVILGAGTVGLSAAKVAMGMGARVTILDSNLFRLRQIDDLFGGRIQTLASNAFNIAAATKDADLLVGSVLIPGALTPKLVTEAMVKTMKPGSAIVDVAIDQGGCFETSRPTTHEDPVYYVDGILHYCVANIPGAVPYSSTLALTNATLPYVVQLADKGWRRACKENRELELGLNIVQGKVVYRPVAEAWGLPCEPLAL